jgi:hypothetical protein
VRPRQRWADLAEAARGRTAPAVALLASSLLMCCLVSLPDLVVGWPGLEAANARAAGWSGLAVVLAVGTAAVFVLLCPRLGSGPPLALGATASVLGLGLSGDVASGGQVVLVLVLLALAVGGLFAAGICLLEELPPRLATLAVLGWLLPWLGGWGVVGWLALHDRSSAETRLGLHPPLPVLTVVALLLLGWSVVTLLIEPPRRPAPARLGWENTWAALGIVVVGAGSLVMLIGFQPRLEASWGRPVVLLAVAVVAAGLVGVALVAPDAGVRPAYLAVVVALATGPGCVQALMLRSVAADGALSWWLLVGLAAVGAGGVLAGWRWPMPALPLGLLAMTGGVAGGWVMPAHQWVMLAAAAPLCLGTAAAAAGGLRWAAVSRMHLRFVAIAGLSGLVLGEVAAAPVAWALGAPITGSADPRGGGRVLLGLTFALTVLSAAVCAVLLDRARLAAARTVDG